MFRGFRASRTLIGSPVSSRSSALEGDTSPLPRIPRIDPLLVVRVEPNGLLLNGEPGHVWLEGESYSRLAPLLDGHRTVRQVVDASGIPPAEALTALVLLAEAGWLCSGDHEPRLPIPDRDALDAAKAAFIEPHRPDRRLAAEPAWVAAGLPPDQRDAVERAVGDLGSAFFEPDDVEADALRGGGPVFVVTSDDLGPEVTELADVLARSRRAWIPVQPFGQRPWAGPLVEPSTLCWRCLRERLRANRAIEACLNLRPPRPWSPQSVEWMLAFARRRISRLAGRVVVDFETSQITAHRVDGFQPCLHSARRSSALHLVVRPLTESSDGGHRTESADSTLRKLESLVDPVTGPVRSLHRSVTDDEGLSVFIAAPSYPGKVDEWRRLQKRLRTRCAGKGRTEAQAKVSALAEAIERYSGFQRNDDTVRTASFRELGESAIDPRRCLLFSERQYEERAAWNRIEEHANWVPHPFDDDEPIGWTPVWSLRDETERYLPTALCFYDPLAGPSPYMRADSNGAAAGNCLEEAILQGFLEVVERDAAAIWWYSRARRPSIDWPAHDEDWSATVRNRLETLDRDAWLLDLTIDLGIPVVAAVSRLRSIEADDLLMGFGAHLDPQLAAERAVAELCQFLVTHADEVGKTRRVFEHAADALDWLASDDDAPRTPHRTDLADPDLAEEVRNCVDLAAEHGFDTLVLRQTRSDTPLEVAKVVVPGLRPWWARFAPGRLYDVPIELGWRSSPLPESRLNPIHLLI